MGGSGTPWHTRGYAYDGETWTIVCNTSHETELYTCFCHALVIWVPNSFIVPKHTTLPSRCYKNIAGHFRYTFVRMMKDTMYPTSLLSILHPWISIGSLEIHWRDHLEDALDIDMQLKVLDPECLRDSSPSAQQRTKGRGCKECSATTYQEMTQMQTPWRKLSPQHVEY